MIEIGQQVLQDIAKSTDLPSFRKYGVYDEMIETIQSAPRGRIALGSYDEEFSTGHLTIPGNEQFNLVWLGKKGTGKTTGISNILNQQYNRFRTPCFIADAAWEYHTQKIRQQNPSITEKLKNNGLPVKGLDMFVCTPGQCVEEGDEETAGTIISYELSDFKKIKKINERFVTITTFMGIDIKSNNPTVRQLNRHINDLPDTFREFEKELRQENIKRKSKKTEEDKEGRATYTLTDTINSLRQREAIGKGQHIYVPKIMQGFDKQPKVVVMQLDIEGSDDPVTSSYLKLAIMDICSDRIRVKKTGKGFLKTPPTVYIDELDLWAPSDPYNPPSKKTIVRLFTKMRKYDISTVGATQQPALISPRIIAASDYIITSRLQDESDKAVFRAKGMSQMAIETIMQDLHQVKGVYPMEHALVKADGSHETFYPFGAGAQLYEEEKQKSREVRF